MTDRFTNPTSRDYSPAAMRGPTSPQGQPKRNADWTQPRVTLTWNAVPAEADVFLRAEWRTTIFDTRPWLHNAHSMGPGRTHAMWNMAARYYFQIHGLLDAATSRSLRVTAREYASVIYPLQPTTAANQFTLPQVLDPEDISAELVSLERNTAIIVAMPVGNGIPVRYWQYGLTFDLLADVPAPPLAVEAAAY